MCHIRSVLLSLFTNNLLYDILICSEKFTANVDRLCRFRLNVEFHTNNTIAETIKFVK